MASQLPLTVSQSESQSYFTTGGIPPINSSLRRTPWDSRPELFSQLNTCGHSPYITSSMTWGWVCNLQLLLALARRFILWSESRGTRDHILLSRIRDFLFCRLLRLSGLRGSYSTPPPHGMLTVNKLRVIFMTRCGEQTEHTATICLF
jgi:hypothetical protein